MPRVDRSGGLAAQQEVPDNSKFASLVVKSCRGGSDDGDGTLTPILAWTHYCNVTLQKHSMSVASAGAMDEMEAVHRKRLAMILRYIADMHHSAENMNPLFVRNVAPSADYFDGSDGIILFSTKDFSRIVSVVPGKSPPFSFYAASQKKSTFHFSRKRIASGSFFKEQQETTIDDTFSNGRPCWLRLTRPVADQPPSRKAASIRDYLRSWNDSTGKSNQELLSSVESIQNAPKIDPTTVPSAQLEIKTFLRLHRKYLQKRTLRNALEPLYNSLFEWLQESHEEELVWGFGNVSVKKDDDGFHVNGPLFEVLVEVELARDGALLVRPRPHTGVTLNREVTAAIGPPDILAKLHKTVADMETHQLSPGQPATFIPLLKKMALELSPDGAFVTCGQARSNSKKDPYKLVVKDAWCVYPRPKPSTVWARDASVLAEKVLVQENVPIPSWSLTHGPTVLSQIVEAGREKVSGSGVVWSTLSSIFGKHEATAGLNPTKPLLPLASSATQNQIAEMLLIHKTPALVVEGPPGTGKSHTIANIICAYLAQGKRVLVTSKGAPALSVLRQRLPKSVQDLCVDVSRSESTGMRQLQQTVERLADRISCINAGIQEEQCSLLKRSIVELERELEEVDLKISQQSDRKRNVMQSADGRQMTELAICLLRDAPWLMKTIAPMEPSEVDSMFQQAKKVFIADSNPIERISGYTTPVACSLITWVAANAGESFSSFKTAATRAVASVLLLGAFGGADQAIAQLQESIDAIRFDGEVPRTPTEWKIILRAMQQEQALHTFETSVLAPLMARDQWPRNQVFRSQGSKPRLKHSFLELLEKAVPMKTLARTLKLSGEAEEGFDVHRGRITAQLQQLSKDLTEATVITQLSRMFSADAQSALIRFAQIAGKAKFSKSSQSAKLSQRQKRHRQEYLDAFERCVRFIPCWIMTSSQISDYLPPELGLFDLVIVDESSQSDVTLLPGMLRGKQWFIVGDGKQVSPTESFVSETQIESLRAALPHSPLKESLLPGQSFFDLCAQGFPQGRAVLCEHFRCAPEIIAFSNDMFYDGKLTPLRLPTSEERLTPSIVDVKVRNGVKLGKSNKKECDVIVKMIKDFIAATSSGSFPRSIGVISLMGEEQSRLIRGRLLDAIGPQKYKEHNILIGEPPNFQGAERDVIFLSMVCSPGSVPTQNQLFHAQRANVALSRARDRMVLVRSIDVSEIPNAEDIKIPVIDFFSNSTRETNQEENKTDPNLFTSSTKNVQSILERILSEKGYGVRRMGVIWNDGICVEDQATGQRAALGIEGAGESMDAWNRFLSQQKVIERVGWKTLRVDAAAFLVDHHTSLESIEKFLSSAGIRKPSEEDELEDEPEDGENAAVPVQEEDDEDDTIIDDNVNLVEQLDDQDDLVVISSDDEADSKARGRQRVRVEDDIDDPGTFGDVVDLDFLHAEQVDEDSDVELLQPVQRQPRRGRRAITNASRISDVADEDMAGDEATANAPAAASLPYRNEDDDYDPNEDHDEHSSPSKKMKTNRRVDRHSRGDRWYPGSSSEGRDEHQLYDTDSDPAPDKARQGEEIDMTSD